MQCYVYVMHHLILSQNTANRVIPTYVLRRSPTDA